MKKLLQLLLLTLMGTSAFAQQFVFDLMERDDLTITELEAIGKRHFDSVGEGRGTGYKHFQRWLYERRFHSDESGRYIHPQTEWNRYLESRPSLVNSRTNAGNWTELGPSGWVRTSSWNPGTGRLVTVAIHPANESVIYVGSPGGGIWKSVNGGANWQPLTDANQVWMYIFSIAIDPVNQNIIYAGTGNNGNQVIKSTDGGASWNQTGAGPGGSMIRKILIHPTNPSIVFACASNGIWRSTNSGASWTQVHSTYKEDIEFKPDDLNIMYATGNDVARSTDNGVTWTTLTSAQGITNTGRTLVAVSPANPNYVYICQASGSLFGRIYKSTDAGVSFNTTVVGNPSSGTNYFGYDADGTGTSGQATHDMGLCVSPTNAEDVAIAGIICWRSVNGATSFTATTEWALPNSTGYNHADVHGLFWINSTMYSISDGGLFKSIDNGDNWTDISNGLGIRQFYRFANSPTNANVITGGAQDNGTAARQASGNWVDWLGADGMEGLVSPTDHLRLWGTSQNGGIYRSINGGNSYSGLSRPNNGDWVTPLAIHPTDHNILFGGWTGVFKSTNAGSSWTNIASGVIATLVTDLAVAPSNPDVIYASRGATLYVTTNGGTTWEVRTAPASITDIAISPLNPDKIWIACNSTSNRVFSSTNGGANFTNISSNLPALSARAIVVDDSPTPGIYVGMNIGVYFKGEGDLNWTDYSDNLPKVAINELEIQKTAGKIRVATYGRGVWESPVTSSCTSAPIADFSTPFTSVCTGQSISFTNNSTNCSSTYSWTFPGGTPGTSTDINPVITYNAAGTYDVSLTVITPGGTNTKTVAGYITVNTNLAHSISISTPLTDICANQSATFTLTNTNPGSSPTITWLKNNSAIPGTSGLTSVTLSGLANSDVITATETTSAGCATPATVSSNAVTMTVSPNVTHTVSIATPKTQLCSGETATFTMTTTNSGTSPGITWYRNGNIIPGTSGQASITIIPVNGDAISVTEISNAKCVSPVSVTSNTITLTVTPTPAKPTITQVVGTLQSSSANGNQWLLNGSPIPNATAANFRPLVNGSYQVQVTINGCAGPISDAVNMTIEGVNNLYPVPTSGQVTFDFFAPEGSSGFSITVYNSAGQLIHQENGSSQPGLNRLSYNWSKLASGVYNLRLQAGTVKYTKRLVIAR
jgi:PKD repeat protein